MKEKDLPRDILDKSTDMIKATNKPRKAKTEEKTAKGVIDKYINHLEDAHGPLADREQRIDQRTQKFKVLTMEVDLKKYTGTSLPTTNKGKNKPS